MEFTSAPHEYRQTGKYKIMVKIVDIIIAALTVKEE